MTTTIILVDSPKREKKKEKEKAPPAPDSHTPPDPLFLSIADKSLRRELWFGNRRPSLLSTQDAPLFRSDDDWPDTLNFWVTRQERP